MMMRCDAGSKSDLYEQTTALAHQVISLQPLESHSAQLSLQCDAMQAELEEAAAKAESLKQEKEALQVELKAMGNAYERAEASSDENGSDALGPRVQRRLEALRREEEAALRSSAQGPDADYDRNRPPQGAGYPMGEGVSRVWRIHVHSDGALRTCAPAHLQPPPAHRQPNGRDPAACRRRC